MLLPEIFFNDFMMEDIWDTSLLERNLALGNAERSMKTDIREFDDHYQLKVDLPGFKKEDISLDLDDGYLKLSASENCNSEKKNESRFIQRERMSGKVCRSFYVGKDVDIKDITAKFRDGIMDISISKRKETDHAVPIK